jgi:hypothetical protein
MIGIMASIDGGAFPRRSTSSLALMRTLVAIACLVVWHSVSASPMCGDSKPESESLLSQEQWNAVRAAALSGHSLVGDTVLKEELVVQRRVVKTGEIAHGKTMQRAVVIPWEQARKMILLGAVRSIFHSQGSKVLLTTLSGRTFASFEPNGGDTRELVNVVDPCRVFISVWSE